ncbi:MAG: flagellar biosynthetic protein FliO [Gammaproteobacteria bacterium]|nr:flagellar biosynthetic protein FliO [Gammaproteobacteria bacterium]
MANHAEKLKPLAMLAMLAAALPAAAAQAPASPIGMAGEVLDGGFMLQFLAGLGIVVLCIVGLAWLLKRAGGLQASARGALRVVDGVALSTRERLVLVQVGDQQVLLGVAPGRVNAVHVLEQPVETITDGAAATESFATRLREVIGREKLS